MKSWIVLLSTLFSNFAANAGPIIVGGGSGESEFAIVFARSNLKQILSDCLAVTCGFTAAKVKDLRPLVDQTSQMPFAIFKASNDLESRVYETHGDEVWFNKDLLWLDSARKTPYEVSDAVKLWLQVLNERGIVREPDLLDLQTRIANALQIEKYEQAYGSDDAFQILLWKTSQTADRLFVSSSADDTVELTSSVVSKLACKGLQSLKFQSPAWMSATPIPNQAAPAQIILKLNLNLNWMCGGVSHTGFGAAIISVFKNSASKFVFDPQTLDLFIGEQ